MNVKPLLKVVKNLMSEGFVPCQTPKEAVNLHTKEIRKIPVDVYDVMVYSQEQLKTQTYLN